MKALRVDELLAKTTLICDKKCMVLDREAMCILITLQCVAIYQNIKKLSAESRILRREDEDYKLK